MGLVHTRPVQGLVHNVHNRTIWYTIGLVHSRTGTQWAWYSVDRYSDWYTMGLELNGPVQALVHNGPGTQWAGTGPGTQWAWYSVGRYRAWYTMGLVLSGPVKELVHGRTGTQRDWYTVDRYRD